MRTLLVLICSVVLVFVPPAIEAGKKKDKKHAQSSAASKSAGKSKKANSWDNPKYSKKQKNWNKTNKAEWSSDGQAYKYKAKYKAKHYNIAYKHNSKIQNVKFEKNYYIKGSNNWRGASYAAFRNYHPEWHDRSWWHSRYNRVVFISGGWYAWNAGWWYPAWGYAPGSVYAYNGPIYGYNGLSPDQVIANVQGALQEQGYYPGEVDGLLGPLTRAAIAGYQRDHGLYITSAIDQPTLESLDMS
jgi:hypothetical protein